MTNICPSNPCDTHDKRATCVTSGNETLCLCTSGFTGTRCSVNKQCSTPHAETGTELVFKYLERRPGSLGMTFCRGPHPSTRFYVCVNSDDNSFWSGQGSKCKGKEIEGTTSTTPSPDNSWTTPDQVVVILYFLLLLIFPCFSYFLRRCKKS